MVVHFIPVHTNISTHMTIYVKFGVKTSINLVANFIKIVVFILSETKRRKLIFTCIFG